MGCYNGCMAVPDCLGVGICCAWGGDAVLRILVQIGLRQAELLHQGPKDEELRGGLDFREQNYYVKVQTVKN